jgi:pimeloyl-ACP methyl ester carboxylesterase
MNDLTIHSATIPIAVRDHGGDGQPLLLLHGAGGNLATMDTLAAHLANTHRVVAVDLRGHGKSGDGPWDWEAVLDDLEAVVGELNLGSPAVAGVSLGGMLAALWAARHPECPGSVSLDGNPTLGGVDQLDGLDPASAALDLARLEEVFDAMEAAMAAPMGEEMRAATQSAMARWYGTAEAFTRGLDGDRVRPRPALTHELRVAMRELDLMPAYRAVRCSLTLVLATMDLPQQEPFHDLYEANRRWIRRRLSTVEGPVTVLALAGASHAMVAECPGELATLIAQRTSSSHSE